MIVTEEMFKKDADANAIVVILERYLAEKSNKALYIFISHKHTETEFVFHLKTILKRYGFLGYVDWEDEGMPLITDAQTAIQIKDRIKGAKKFILIATEAAIESKWCNWEVGFADAHKFENHIALFPVRKANNAYTGEEYLGIYPSIQVREEFLRDQLRYYVRYPDGRELSLDDWLKI